MAECKEILDNEPSCDSCSIDNERTSKDAHAFCCGCMDFLCLDCAGDHYKNEVLKSHTVLEKQDKLFNSLRDVKEILYCKEHGNLRVYVCEDHAELICEVCVKRNHRNCKKLTKSVISPQDAKQNISGLDEEVQTSYEKRSRLSVRQASAMAKQKVLLGKLQNFVEASIKRNDRGDANETSGVEREKICSYASFRYDIANAVSKLNDSTKEQIVANYIHLSLKKNGSILCDPKDLEQNIIEAEEFTKTLALMHRISINPFQDVVIGAKSGCGNTQGDKQTVETQTDPTPGDVQLKVDNICSSETNHDTRKQNTKACATKGNYLSTTSDTVDTVEDDQYSTGSDSAPGMVKPVVNNASTMTHNVQLVDTESQTNQMDYHKPSTPLSQRSIIHSETYDICQRGEEFCRITDVLVVNNDNIVIADSWNDNLKLYNHDFQLKCVVATQGEPISICRITDDRIVVSLDTKSVNIYSVTDSLVFLKQFKLKYHCRGICTTSANTIALLLSDIPMRDEFGDKQDINSEDDKILIEFRSPSNGQILHVIDQFDYGEYGAVLEKPSFIIEDTRGNIVVGEADQLTAFDTNGYRQWFYNRYDISKFDGTIRRKLFQSEIHTAVGLEGTQGMDTDGEGNIYVCGYDSNNIHQVFCWKHYKRNRVIIPYVPAPISVAYDSFNDRLIVGCDNSKCLHVYDFV